MHNAHFSVPNKRFRKYYQLIFRWSAFCISAYKFICCVLCNWILLPVANENKERHRNEEDPNDRESHRDHILTIIDVNTANSNNNDIMGRAVCTINMPALVIYAGFSLCELGFRMALMAARFIPRLSACGAHYILFVHNLCVVLMKWQMYMTIWNISRLKLRVIWAR